VVINEIGSRTKESYTIVGAAEADPKEGRISNESPLGRALLGHKAGDTVVVEAPDGAFSVKITEVA
jgi:transcription elongation factor GreA